MCVCMFSYSLVSNSATPWTAAHQAPLFIGFSRQACWIRLAFPFPGNLPNPRMEPVSPALLTDSLPLSWPGSPAKTLCMYELWTLLSRVQFFATPWTVVHEILQARILEWVLVPFSRGSSQPRNQTQVSRIAGRLFTSWAAREAPKYWSG